MNPHEQSISYDGFSNITSRSTEQWGTHSDFARTYEQTTGRLQPLVGNTMTYDESGNILSAGTGANTFQNTVYDAAGRRSGFTERWQTTGSYSPIVSETLTTQSFDGDNQVVKNVTRLDRISDPASTGTPITTYFVNSSVLGKNISEVEFTNGSETKRRTNIWAGSAVIAEQRKIGGQDVIIYLHADPVTGSKVETSQSGQEAIYIGSNQVYEPLGQAIRRTPPFQEPPPPNPPPILNDSKSPEWQCTLFNMMGRSNDKMLPRHCSMVNEQDVWNTYYITPKNPGNPSALTNHASGGSGSGTSDEPSRGFSVVKKRCSDPSEDDCTFRGPNAWEEKFEHNDAANGIDDSPITGPSTSDNAQCYTFSQLIYENPDVRRFINRAWRRTVESAEAASRAGKRGVEHGGIVIFDNQGGRLNFSTFKPNQPTAGARFSIPDPIGQIEGFLKQMKSEGRSGNILLVIHTHPPDGPFQMPGPYLNDSDQAALFTWSEDAVTGDPRVSFDDDSSIGHSIFGSGPHFGLVVYGKGRYKVYAAGRDVKEDELRRKCTKLSRPVIIGQIAGTND